MYFLIFCYVFFYRFLSLDFANKVSDFCYIFRQKENKNCVIRIKRYENQKFATPFAGKIAFY